MAVSVGSENVSSRLTLAPGESVMKLFTYGRPAGPAHEVLPFALASVAFALRLSVASDKGAVGVVAAVLANVTAGAKWSVRPSRLEGPRATLICDGAASGRAPTTTDSLGSLQAVWKPLVNASPWY